MTINEAICKFKEERPGAKLSNEQMIERLSRLDMRIKNDIIDTHKCGDGDTFSGYGSDTDEDTVLLAPAPYDCMYISWLDCQNELLLTDYERYNRALSVFQEQYDDYAKYYLRTHKPYSRPLRYF